ncbi:helix-turn-helix domain-containing protein [Mucilaginibacter kameinonensis]|uniref:helix-turn-helix domain-containing protein n=1 Tax=Mucilaginibacter kameinonensis TaxID=452286 RepID=UPI000EF75A5B|nr:AraC family transcriptional regulator [Mucilaginibacter kameinonensis]
MKTADINGFMEIEHLRTDKCTQLTCNKSVRFQMVYVVAGKGSLSMNENKMSYRAENLLLLTPGDPYRFDINDTSEFLFIRVTSNYIRNYSSVHIDCLESLLYHAGRVSGCVMNDQGDSMIVSSISETLLREISNEGLYGKDLILHFVNALLIVAARNIARLKPAGLKAHSDDRVLEMISYIQKNIHQPECLKLQVIARVFGLAPTYLSSYFKQQSGQNIQDYIANYRLRLIEHRLRYSDHRIGEIAAEFGFSDESHLNKFFKKHKQVGLTQYRKNIYLNGLSLS